MKSLALIIGLLVVVSCSKTDFDLLILNGSIVDGSGVDQYKADIGIINDRIVQIGVLSDRRAAQVIDAANMIVSPGFIDSHTHAIRGIFDVPTAESSLLQ